ncbi:X-box-binding protein [Schistosoma japonicum]|uniref:X-box-binding protein 1 n=1 Tax=Schistosoma japonicum TaxID=6182 RepID=A0A4Z2CT64_SCHJA|nr:X-box-binding protein [Schistosoma japonicum]TNN07427.1 X-box-binding protein [Schistosoma japonicum]
MWSPFVLTVNSSSCASDKITLGRRLVPYPVPNTMLSHRKRARLDNLTEEEKIIRRKILNREAAQKARDRKKDLMENMEENLAQLRWENEYLRSSNRMLRLKFIEQEQKFQALQEKLSGIIKHVELFSGTEGSGSLSVRSHPSPQLRELAYVQNPNVDDVPEDISSTLFDAQTVEVSSQDISETQKPRDSDCSDDLVADPPCLYESILCSLQDDHVEVIPGLADSYDSEESLGELLDVLNCDVFDSVST